MNGSEVLLIQESSTESDVSFLTNFSLCTNVETACNSLLCLRENIEGDEESEGKKIPVDLSAFSDDDTFQLRSQNEEDCQYSSLSGMLSESSTTLPHDLKPRDICFTSFSTPETIDTVDVTDMSSHCSANQSCELTFMKYPVSQGTIQIDDYNRNQFEVLTANIETSVELSRLDIRRSTVENCQRRSITEMVRFFCAIRGLPHLRDLTLRDFNAEDTELLSLFLNQHPTLETLHLQCAHSSMGRKLLRILSQLPCLNTLVLDGEGEFLLSLLADSKSIASLTLSGNFQFERNDFDRAMELWRDNDSLKVVDLEIKIGLKEFRSLCHAIEGNSSVTRLYCSFQPNDLTEGKEALLLIAKSLSRNSTLHEFGNHNFEQIRVSQEDKACANELLESNKVLEYFQFYEESDESEMWDSSIVHSNFSCGPIDIIEWVKENHAW